MVDLTGKHQCQCSMPIFVKQITAGNMNESQGFYVDPNRENFAVVQSSVETDLDHDASKA